MLPVADLRAPLLDWQPVPTPLYAPTTPSGAPRPRYLGGRVPDFRSSSTHGAPFAVSWAWVPDGVDVSETPNSCVGYAVHAKYAKYPYRIRDTGGAAPSCHDTYQQLQNVFYATNEASFRRMALSWRPA